jgi:hypothetical protein
MSTKTITKRVALATVVALGAGVLSLVSVSSANASTVGQNSLPGNAGPAATAGVLNIGTAANLTATPVLTDGAAASSVGLIAVSDITGSNTPTAGTTQTAVLASNGKLVVYTGAGTAPGGTIVVTGGTITNTVGSTGLSTDRTAMSYAHNVAVNSAQIEPSAGTTTLYVRAYKLGATTDGDVTSPTSGTLYGQITVTVSATNTSGVVSVAKSGIYYAKNGTSTANTAVNSDDTTSLLDSPGATYKSGASAIPYNVTNFAIIAVKDVYGQPITSGTGLLTATATNGAYVGLAANTAVANTNLNQSTAFTTVRPDGATLAVSDPTSAPLSTTVTIAYNGVTIGTKTFNFTGAIAKVTIAAANRIEKTSHSAAASYDGAAITFSDSAGNKVYPVSGDVAYPTAAITTSAKSDRGTVILSVTPTSTATGYIDWTCGTADTTDNAIVQYTNIDGTIVTSNAAPVSCAGTATAYTMAFDKSTYTPGSLATLSVTFKDSKGNLAADYLTSTVTDDAYFTNYDATTATLLAISGGTLASAPSKKTYTSLGVKNFTILTGITEGTYQSVLNLGSSVSTIASTSNPQVAGFTLASGSTSLNDVLKGIVSLIASINKQIAALAKLVTKK